MPILDEHCTLIDAIERLCGQKPTLHPYLDNAVCEFPKHGLGYSQFNELLLSLHLDRVTEGFFFYVFRTTHVRSLIYFRDCIERFCVKAIRQFGSIKFSFKKLSQLPIDQIRAVFAQLDARPDELLVRFKRRHLPLVSIREIPPNETYYLGYLVDKELDIRRNALEQTGLPLNEIAQIEQRRDKARKIGTHNHHCYLDYDHMDVYVATSMREKYDFWNVHRFVKELFNQDELQELNLRYFDPTQAYCQNRLDKGLAEGLMLKRAKCAIYMAGETDTLGKDSELATTLAQGKPVIVYLPRLRDFGEFKRTYVDVLMKEVYAGDDPIVVALQFLKVYFPDGPWVDHAIRQWIGRIVNPTFDEILRKIFDKAQELYDRRAKQLLDSHPLGLQMNLDTGVANGVLVTRDVPQCAAVLRRVLLNELVFDIEEDQSGSLLLKEHDTKSIFRVVTRDGHLTNSFWNFYLKT